MHLMTGPVFVEGAEPGDTLRSSILEMRPRWHTGRISPPTGAFATTFGKERITIYEPRTAGRVRPRSPVFGFDFVAASLLRARV